jgi:internalin A
VATHCDERYPELNYPRLRQVFPEMLAGRHQVDNRSGNGIEELRVAIAAEAAKLPQMGQLLNPRWIAARDEILARANSEPQIPFYEFAETCQRHHLTDQETTTLANLLHDLGQIIYYGDDEGLRDVVVLNPEWLTKAISYVLSDEPTREAQGVLDHARLHEIWQGRPSGPSYPARYHPYFLRLMEKFDVSYRLEGDERHSLVAQLVPYEQPPLPWNVATPVPDGVRSLALICQLSEPAPGLMAWLTVRHHRASTGKHWREGVFLRHPIDLYASEALLALDDDRRLTLGVRAPSPDLFFNVLRDSIEDLITRRWPGLNYQLLVPCPTQLPNATACSGAFKLETLLRRRERSKASIACQECDEDHDIVKLLTGFALPTTPLETELDHLQDQLSNIAGGVDRLERYAAETADSMRRVLKAVGTEITDCPRLFTLAQERASGVGRARIHEDHYRLVLWCEHPSRWHPWTAATYHLNQPKEWLVRIAPYVTLVFKTLKLVIPIAGAVAGVVLSQDQLRHAEHELELMATVVDKLPDVPGQQEEMDLSEPPSQLTFPEGEALRGLRALLFEQDRGRSFGDLRRVHAPSGDFLWVCPTHYPEYDPGLPNIPGSQHHPE